MLCDLLGNEIFESLQRVLRYDSLGSDELGAVKSENLVLGRVEVCAANTVGGTFDLFGACTETDADANSLTEER